MVNFISRKGFLSIFAVFLPQLLYFTFLHTWEVDAHHDGIMYTGAVGAYQGLFPNRDFFAQYGPGAPLIQGLWFQVTSPTVWNLKILTSLCLAIIGVLIFCGSFRVIKPVSSLAVSYLWMLTGPFGLPWSSIFSTLLLLTCILFLDSLSRNHENPYFNLFSFVVGALLALGIFIRIHVAVCFIALNLGLLLISRGRVSKRLLSYINLGFFFTFLAVLLYLEQFDALRFYLEQCILWASSAYVGAPVVSVSLIADLLWIPFFAGVSALVFLIYFKLGSRHVSTQLSIFSFFSALFLFAPVLSGIEKVGPQSLRNPRILLIIGSQKAQFSYAYFVLITSMILLTGFLLLMIRKRGNTLTQNQSPFKLAIALIGISSLSQLYPFADNYHIAFISPILILAAIIVIPKKIIDFRVQKSLNWLLLTLIPMLFLKFYWEASTERIPFESSTLKGMYGSWRTASSLDRTMQKLELQEPGIDFVCADGLYAGAGGRYLANNEKFVTWGPPTEKSEIGDRLFICYANQQLIDSYLNSGWTILFKVFWRPMDVSQKIPTWNVLLTTKKE